jgi:hypothetical protein
VAALPLFQQDRQGTVTLWNPLQLDKLVFLEPQVVTGQVMLFTTNPLALQLPVGGAVTTSITETQGAQADSVVVAETYSAALSESQAAQTESIIIAETYKASIAETQSAQADSAVVKITFSFSVVETQSSQVDSIIGNVAAASTSASLVETQAVQSDGVVILMVVPTPVHERGGSSYNVLNRRVLG